MGRVLPSEFKRVFETAARDCKRFHLSTQWNDQRKATIWDLADLDPIDDAGNISSAYARIEYEDGSKLIVSLGSFKNTLEADKGQAVDRLTEVEQYWHTLPQRARYSALQIHGMRGGARFLALFPLFWIAAVHFYGESSVGNTALNLAMSCAGVTVWLGCRFSETARADNSIVRLHRPESGLNTANVIAACGAVASVACAVVAVLAYVNPPS
ncbi:hypothetical protein [Rhodococcus sp. 05-2254-6]|uniref:hypothetical protein n=1 Tax=Rhodococcus sp. 05-2254-6 TaxID=2022489 RepID=UPI001179CD78|nr:hypothetical protein [Rhodococcus sp. 05-2254-6]